MPEASILVVDDDRSIREILALLLARSGFRVTTCGSVDDAQTRLRDGRFDLVLSDLNMPGRSGLDLLRALRSGATGAPPDLPMVLLTAYGTATSAVQAMKEGASDYVLKPFDNDELVLVLQRALGQQALVSENRALRRELQARYAPGTLVGSSLAMREVLELVDRVKDVRVSCLIEGESGTGKELVARAIHFGGARARGPFVAVNCGAIPEALFESELFGHKKGAFTGAAKDKQGYFSAADGGTLFLDEIGEMPLSAQVKLLRVLADRKVVAIGATAEETVDVRVVAATNRSLEAEVQAGRFREDLYYRLNVVRIELPPLRARPEDLIPLAEHFLAMSAKEQGRAVSGFTPEALEAIRAYSWPGNVRELQNAVERAVALEVGHLVTPRGLPQALRPAPGAAPRAAAPTEELGDEGMDLDAHLAAIERTWLVKALEKAGGNRTQAARLLGMTFRSFRYRLAKFGMDEGEP